MVEVESRENSTILADL